MAYSNDQPGLRPDIDDEIEEGEIVPGYGSGSDTDDDSRYVFQPRDDDEAGRPGIIKRRRLKGIFAGGRDALLSPTSSCGSEGTISDGSTGAGDAPVAPASFPCPICRREFGSQKAVHGHMRVHDPHGRQGQEKERPVTLGGSWAVTGKRGCIGGRVFPEDEVDSSMSNVVALAEPKLSVAEPMPMAIARTNLSFVKIEHGSSITQPNPNESMAVVVAATNTSNQVVAHPPAAPHVVAHQPAAPQVVAHPPAAPHVVAHQPAAPQVVAHQPAAPQVVAHQPAAPQVVAHPPATPQVVAHQPAAPPPAGSQGQHAAPPAGEQGHFEGYTCSECGKRFSTHQGLGGHVAGHKNRRREAAAAEQGNGTGTVACRGGAKPEKMHVCKVCAREFKTGVALGGHMRKHYAGPPIGQKKQDTSLCLYLAPPGEVLAPAAMEAPELTLALPVEEAAQPAVLAVIEVAQPAPAPAATGSVRIFGVNIVQTPAEQEGSAVTEDSASTTRQ